MRVHILGTRTMARCLASSLEPSNKIFHGLTIMKNVGIVICTPPKAITLLESVKQYLSPQRQTILIASPIPLQDIRRCVPDHNIIKFNLSPSFHLGSGMLALYDGKTSKNKSNRRMVSKLFPHPLTHSLKVWADTEQQFDALSYLNTEGNLQLNILMDNLIQYMMGTGISETDAKLLVSDTFKDYSNHAFEQDVLDTIKDARKNEN